MSDYVAESQEEAIRILRSALEQVVVLEGNFKYAVAEGIVAIEKQIPTKPTIVPFAEIIRQKTCYYVKCPSCGYELSVLEFMNDKKRIFAEKKEWQNNCWKCGQKIDWD